MQKNNIFVTRSSMPPKEEYYKEIESIWENHILTNMGEKHQRLENELQKYLEVPHVSLFSNGHMALEMVLQAMKLEGEVITTPFTFASTTHAIVRNRLTPVFCDINPVNYTIDVDLIEGLITDKTCAILPVHVYGNICDIFKIQEIANKYKLKVIYDAAHTFGERLWDNGVGKFGDASVFSFHATKVFNTIEGGAVCYNNEELGKDLYGLKNFGIRSEFLIDGIGANAKMNEFQAAMGLCNLKYISQEIEKRKVIFQHYYKELKNITGLVLPAIQEGVISNYAYFPILVNSDVCETSRDVIHKCLAEQNVFARKYFYPLTNTFKCYQGKSFIGETPVANKIANQVLTLPIYADLEIENVSLISELIKKCFL